jgi:uncharacterized protein (DUF2141 family)
MKYLRLLALAGGLCAVAAPTSAGTLRITFDGVRSAGGAILIGVYDSKASFDRAIELSDKDGFLNDPQRVAGIALRAGAALGGGIVFENLDPGRYAVIVLHDEDGNGRLDKNFWGVPIEPYGFSNNAQGFLGPPGFKDAAVDLDAREKSLTIALVRHAQGLASLSRSYLEEDGEAKPVSPASSKPGDEF